jgi:PTS system nitrogen regulatory IIA component
MTDDQLMSVRDLADYLQVDMSTVYLWSQRGQIPAMKVGRMWRYRRSEIDAWLESRRTPAVKEPSSRSSPTPLSSS